MTTTPVRVARSEAVGERILEGAAAVLARGDHLTFAEVAAASGVSERTVYRRFPTRQALLDALFHWANRRIGFRGALPVDGESATDLVRTVFPGFDDIAPVIRELLVAPEGRVARLADNDTRRRASLALVGAEVPELDAANTRRVAAVVQLLTAASTWQALHDYWDMDGSEAAETASLAIELLLEGARVRAERGDLVNLLTGINHVAVMTQDLDRFVDFYTDVFGLEVVFEETNPAFRHAILRTGETSWLHPAEVTGNPYAAALPSMFDRGHLDHVALVASSYETFEQARARLVERGTIEGAVDDLGAFHALWFEDPDGMQVELTVIVDAELRTFHEPRPLATAPG